MKSSYRSQGIGKQLLTYVVNHANENNCNYVDFDVYDWNPAKKFYENMNAINLTVSEGVQYYRINKDSIKSMCGANK